MIKIQIIVGSVNGTAEKTAYVVAEVLRHQGHQVRLNASPTRQDLEQDRDEVLLVCCSTTGEGEVPDNLNPLYRALDDQAIEVKGRHYGVIALGDSGFRYFAYAGFLMENALYMAGAIRIGEVCTLDAQVVTNHPLAAAQWANDWVGQLA